MDLLILGSVFVIFGLKKGFKSAVKFTVEKSMLKKIVFVLIKVNLFKSVKIVWVMIFKVIYIFCVIGM